MNLVRTDSRSSDFIALVALLDKDLAVYDGDDHAFYDQYNKIDRIEHVLVAYEGNTAVACGAIKHWDQHTVEVKRMFVLHGFRGRGFSKLVLGHLELWASELGYQRCILETGKIQKEAVGLYTSAQYHVIDNYGPYAGVENSVCFEKLL